MKQAQYAKSSFSLPATEIPLILKLRKKLHLRSNTEVVRKALEALEENTNRMWLKKQFAEASLLVSKANKQDLEELDHLAGENL